MNAGSLYVGGTLSLALTISCSLSSGIRIEHDSPSAAAAKRIFSITHHIVANGFSAEIPSSPAFFALYTGMTTYGALLSMVNCLGTA